MTDDARVERIQHHGRNLRNLARLAHVGSYASEDEIRRVIAYAREYQVDWTRYVPYDPSRPGHWDVQTTPVLRDAGVELVTTKIRVRPCRASKATSTDYQDHIPDFSAGDVSRLATDILPVVDRILRGIHA